MQKILIIDYGSQYTQLIARRVRELQVYCEIHPCTLAFDAIAAFDAQGIILSGSPFSALDHGSPTLDPRILELGVPVLGICYGMQVLTHTLGGQVEKSAHREFGKSALTHTESHPLFAGIQQWPMQVWMSHGDRVITLPAGYRAIATSEHSPFAAIARDDNRVLGVQFHPEVVHTPEGATLLKNFVFGLCGCAPTWTMASFIETQIAAIRAQVGSSRVICGLSGGVDSSVAAVLIHRAIGDQLHCIFVDNGFLRKNEATQVEALFRDTYHINLRVVDAADRFLDRVAGVTDPEKKRKHAGNEFIAVFDEAADALGGADFLAQGTLYPDVIESVSFKGPSATIKTHHNVGGLPDTMKLQLLEPFRELFKDEVRQVGRELGLPESMINRHPFPGPGLLIRVLGEVTRERLDVLRAADAIMLEELHAAGWYEKTWQTFCVLLPVKTVGVMGDERTYESVVAIRSVSSVDGMTADWSHLPHDVLGRMSNRIINEVRGINRVVYDITSKPPGTIEWE